MKQLILTSPKFEGELELIYDSAGLLVSLDMRRAKLNENQTALFKKYVLPVYSETGWPEMFESFTFLPKEYKIPFEMFWSAYGKKVNKLRVEKIWNRLSEANKVKAYQGIIGYDNHLKLNTWKSKADPENYLKNQSWENEWK